MEVLVLSVLLLFAFSALGLWLLLTSGRPFFRSLWELSVASARSGTGLNPGRYQRFASEGEIFEMEARDRNA